MFEAIYASKLYRASTRKSKIRAAIEDPKNKQLVAQFAGALDRRYQTAEYLTKESEESQKPKSNSRSDTSTSDLDSQDNLDNDTGSSMTRNPRSSHSDSIAKDSNTSSQPESDISDESTTSQPDTKPSSVDTESVEQSTAVKGKSVFGSFPRVKFPNIQQVSEQIKGMLNLKDTTHGVERVTKKDNELWIYYNDNINLNNVMVDVIELLNASSYVFLEFNRLARSENAIVFQIDFADTWNKVNSLNED